MRCRMAVESSSPGGIRRVGSSSNDERAALEGMLKGYPVEQLVEEVLVAWDELGKRNDELVAVKQRTARGRTRPCGTPRHHRS